MEKYRISRRRLLCPIFFVLLAGFILDTIAMRAFAIPVYARKYRTSCITCHAGFPKLNSVGESFRRNGYQFPQEDEEKVKEEPVPLGTEAWKDLWPDSIWPSDIPHLPPVAFRARLGTFFNNNNRQPDTDFRYPQDLSLLSSGTLGKDISWYAGFVLAGKGAHGGGGHGGEEEAGFESELERMFVQFSNLFAWSDEEDEDGMRMGNRWLSLPKHALNLRVGQFEPQVVAPWASIHRQLGITGRLPNLATIGSMHGGANSFTFEPALRGIELHGTIAQNNSYAIGIVNGNGIGQAWDNNSSKDFYFRVARKWWGYPLDGEIAPLEGADQSPKVEIGAMGVRPGFRRAKGRVSKDEMATVNIRGQSPDEVFENDDTPSLDFWREVQFETGVFGYFGRNAMEMEIEGFDDEVRWSNGFHRVGFDFRCQKQDLDIFGAFIFGQDDKINLHDDEFDPDEESFFTWFLEVDYYFKPWAIGFVRYEEQNFQSGLADQNIARLVPGAAFYARTNVRIITELLLDTTGKQTTQDSFQIMLDLAY